VFLLCVGSWQSACRSGPVNITQDTMHQCDNYRYDGLLAIVIKICQTLKIRKLSRSKYDRYTHKQVPRFDHHCGWLSLLLVAARDKPQKEQGENIFTFKNYVVHIHITWILSHSTFFNVVVSLGCRHCGD
jgi:hypothetical protein